MKFSELKKEVIASMEIKSSLLFIISFGLGLKEVNKIIFLVKTGISILCCCIKIKAPLFELCWEKAQNDADKKNITLKKVVLYFFIFYYFKKMCVC